MKTTNVLLACILVVLIGLFISSRSPVKEERWEYAPVYGDDIIKLNHDSAGWEFAGLIYNRKDGTPTMIIRRHPRD